MKSLKVVIVYASRYGHTKLQAEAVARGAAAVPEMRSSWEPRLTWAICPPN